MYGVRRMRKVGWWRMASSQQTTGILEATTYLACGDRTSWV
jgi:hypothetical protein